MNVWQQRLIDSDSALVGTAFEDQRQLLVLFLHQRRPRQIRERFIRKPIRYPNAQAAQTERHCMIVVEISVIRVHVLVLAIGVNTVHQKTGNLFWLILEPCPDGNRLAPETSSLNLTLMDTLPEEFVLHVSSAGYNSCILISTSSKPGR